jgi:hypothetical protein
MDIEKVSDIISSLSVPNGLQYKEWVSNSIFTDEEDKGCVEENLYDRLLKLLEPSGSSKKQSNKKQTKKKHNKSKRKTRKLN